ncbi:MAG: topoisomerase DNA-binding C4 zinc finger domain-containing protein [Burkholderiales bacterium]|nr:topoisomerase DNA-binding C4 zinc finger domain-containing protein [Burkholderiales bacterium]
MARRQESVLEGSSTSASDSKVAPACPQCGSTMIMKTARKGANVGGFFLRCSTFPKCRGTRPA